MFADPSRGFAPAPPVGNLGTVFAEPKRGFAPPPPVEALVSVSSILSYTMAPKLHWTFQSIYHIYHEQHISEKRNEPIK